MQIQRYSCKSLKRLDELKTIAKCIIVYGSRSSMSDIIPNTASDIDLFVVCKDEMVGSIYAQNIKKEIPKEYDLFWYDEKHFLSVIEEGIDLVLFSQIFSYGDVLHDDNFVKFINCKIKGRKVSSSFYITFAYRQLIFNKDLRKNVRNISRIFFDYMCFQIAEKDHRITIDKLQQHEKIIEMAEKIGILNENERIKYMRLRKFSKYSTSEIARNRVEILRHLVDIDIILRKKILHVENIT